MIIGLFCVVAFIGLFFLVQIVADQLDARRSLPPVTQRTLPPLPGTYVEEVRSRVPSRLKYSPGELLVLACEGYCSGRTARHEDAGDGTATCTRCGTPRHTTTDGD